MQKSITWKIGGEAGFGIMASGNIFARTYTRLGYNIIATNEYPSLIRGGHNVITVKVGTEDFKALTRDLDILVALNKETVSLHRSEIKPDTLVLYDPKDYDWSVNSDNIKAQFIPVPLSQMIVSLKAQPIMRNTLAMGAAVSLLGTAFTSLHRVIADTFSGKGDAIVKDNLDVARAGYDYIRQHFPDKNSKFLQTPLTVEKRIVVTGSEAFGIAAVRAGLQFAAIYPMTPINAIIAFLSAHAQELGVVYKQPEDEIAGINMAIGAAIAGARSMVATSGGGFALMVEGLSLAGMTETPLVINLGMRVGPATGMPTWTEQGELKFVISAGHGDFPRIILAPGDITEIFEMTVMAFDLADKYQVPVFVLTDKYLNESTWAASWQNYSVPVNVDRSRILSQAQIDSLTDYKRYDLVTANGVSPRGVPGLKNGVFVANSYEHDEHGFMTETPDGRKEMTDKRLKKQAAIITDSVLPQELGSASAKIAFVDWGSTKGIILEAIKLLAERGIEAALIHFKWIYPLEDSSVKSILSKYDRIIDVEQNATAQLASVIAAQTGIIINEKLLKYDGRPFFPEEIADYIKKI